MSKQQIHSARLEITRGIELRPYQGGGVVLELRAEEWLLGRVTFTGANVFFEKGRMRKHWTFSEFAEILKNS